VRLVVCVESLAGRLAHGLLRARRNLRRRPLYGGVGGVVMRRVSKGINEEDGELVGWDYLIDEWSGVRRE
jgi:hypothetical protein